MKHIILSTWVWIFGLLHLSAEKWNTDHRDKYNNTEIWGEGMIRYEPVEKTFTKLPCFQVLQSFLADWCLYAEADVFRWVPMAGTQKGRHGTPSSCLDKDAPASHFLFNRV